jgi:protein TonB
LVTVPAPSAPVVATSPTPPPPQAVVVAPPAADPGPPAPITPPDASAASLKNPSPRYPLESRREHEEGTVRLRVVITVDGHVKDIDVARSSGFDRLDKAALDAVRRWKFQPGSQAGRPVEAMGFLNIPFKLAA